MRLSKRAGTIVTLDELVDEIGVDALRYSLARYPADSPLTLDVEQMTKASSDNPVYYVQYAHARLVLDPAQRGRPRHRAPGDDFDPSLLTHEQEGDLLRALAEFPRVVAGAAELREPHRVARYLEDTAATFHRFYDSVPGAAAGRRGDRPTCTGRGSARRGDPDRLRQRARPARRLRPGADVRRARARGRLGCTPTARCADRPGCGSRSDPNELVPLALVEHGAQERRRRPDRRRRPLRRAGRASTAPRRTSSTRPTSAPAPAPSATPFAGLRRLLRGQGLPLHRPSPAGSRRRGSASTSARAASSPSR